MLMYRITAHYPDRLVGRSLFLEVEQQLA